MKHYKLLKEHDSHFDLEHEKQGKFVVAKYGLDDATIKKIRSFGAARYAEGTEDARGVKVEDAPAFAMSQDDQDTRATNDIVAPWRNYQAAPADYVLSPEEENYQIAQSMRAREEGLVPTRRTQGVNLPEGGDIIDLSPTLQGKDQSGIKWYGQDIPKEPPVADVLAAQRGEEPPPLRIQPGYDVNDDYLTLQQTGEKPFVEEDLLPQQPKEQKTTEAKGIKDDLNKTVEGLKENLNALSEKFLDFFSKKEEQKPVPQEVLKPKTSEPKGIKDDFNKTVEGFKSNLDSLGDKINNLLTPESQATIGQTPPVSVQEDLKKSYEAIKNNFNFLLQKAGVAPEDPKPGAVSPPVAGVPAQPGAGKPLPYQQQNQKGLGQGPGGIVVVPPTGTQLAGSGLPQDPLKAGEEAFKGLKQANLAMGQIEAQRELDSGQAQLTALNQLRDLDKTFKTNLKNIDDEQKKLTEGIVNFKIDPNRVYARMSSGNRVLAAIGLLLGGVSQGLLKLRTNPAMDVINDTINRDIDAQKANLGIKQSLLAINLERYKRLDAATAATRAQLLTVVQAQINIAAAKANSGLAVKNAQIANYKLDLEKAKLNQSIATQATMGQVLNTQQGVPPEYVMRLPEEIREILVRVPNGKFYPAISKKAAEDANKGLQAVSTIKGITAKAKNLFDQGTIMPWDSKAKGMAESYSSQLDLEIKNLAGLGVLSQSDLDIISGMKPDLTAWTFRDREQAKLNELNRYIDSRVNSFLIQAVPNYSPGNITETPVGP